MIDIEDARLEGKDPPRQCIVFAAMEIPSVKEPF
jgi:hypothetical protein